MKAEGRILAGCHHLDSRDWSAFPVPCKTAVKASQSDDGASLQNASRKPDACKLEPHERL